MNYIKHLTGFFNKINNENAVNPTHISLYLALFQCWNVNRFKNPTGISREEIMKASKINSKATYHKCIKKLQTLGFIEYLPNFNPHSSSNIIMVNLSNELKKRTKNEQLTSSNDKPIQNLTISKNEQVFELVNTENINKNGGLKKIENQKQSSEPIQNSTLSKNEHVSEQVYIDNNKTYTNNINNIYAKSKNSKQELVQKVNLLNNSENEEKEKSCAKKEMLEILADDNRQIVQTFADTEKKQTEKDWQNSSAKKEEANKNETTPSIEIILEYFAIKESSEIEANKFFNYYSSIGWLVGGKTKMKDWKASARNWIMNQNKFQPKSNRHSGFSEGLKPNHLHTINSKNYAEPL